MVTISPRTDAAYKLLHDATLTLAKVESHGMRIDVARLDKNRAKIKVECDEREEKLRNTKIFKTWRRVHGRKTNLWAPAQLGKVLFDELGYECKSLTPGLRPKTDEKTLEDLDIPFVKEYLAIKKLRNARSTFLGSIKRELCGEFIHSVFNLHIVRTYRTSCDHPNIQNMPTRDEVMAKLIRSVFIPRDGFRLVEIDFTGIEVRVANCYHCDPTMTAYNKDDSKDLHRDMAMELYCISPREWKELEKLGAERGEKWAKNARYTAKNQFVFPEFYGSWFNPCAKMMWEHIHKLNLCGPGGVPMREWLRSKGITKLGRLDKDERPRPGTFEYHVHEIEKDLWERRFPVYAQWKKEWYAAYLRKGYFDSLTGFRYRGDYDRNDVINYPVQGSAAHWLLWCLIQLQRRLEKYNMRTLIIGQIHDSMNLDVYEPELEDVIEMALEIITEKLPKHWDWINVPVKVEVETCEPGASWYTKNPMSFRGTKHGYCQDHHSG